MNLGSVLHVYKGEYGLPSIDFDCLRALCLIRFTRCPVRIDHKGNPFSSGEGKLPYLEIGNKKYVGYKKIKQILDSEGFSVDSGLKQSEKLSTQAWIEWVFINLHAYYNYFMFGEPNNFEIVHSLYAKRTAFPFSFYYPGTYRKKAYNVIQIFGNFNIYDKVENHQTDEIIIKAKRAVNLLSSKLGKKLWFFGDIFSEVDVIVYSYLSILMQITVKNNPLGNHIKACKNLVNFINRITKDVFKNETFTSPNNIKRFPKTSDIFLTPSEQQFLESETKTKVFAGIGAVVAMSAYFAWRTYSTDFGRGNRVTYINIEDEDADGDDLE